MKRTIICISVILIFCLGTKAQTQNIPSLNEIVNKVKDNSLPDRGYNVQVTQSIAAPANSNIGKTIASGTMQKQNTFSAEYSPIEGLNIKKQNNIKKHTTKSIQNVSPQNKAGNIKLYVNLNTVFKDVNSWQNVNITLVKLNGTNNFLITGKYNVIDFKIWVNSENYYVSRLDFSVSGHEFAQTDFNCKHVNNKYWLPSQVTISHTMDGSQITQHFGTYKFQ